MTSTDDTTLDAIRDALRAREPIFHRPEWGTRREDFEAMVEPDFWEVGASGQCYDRAFVLDTLVARHAAPVHEDLQVSDFACRALGDDTYLVTYRLAQGERLSRRSTIWRRHEGRWRIVYHQGTLIAAP